MKNPVRIFNNHNGVVHNNPQRQQQGEQYHDVQGETQRGHEQESQHGGQRHGQSHEKGAFQPHKKQQNEEHEQEAQDDRIDEVVELHFRLVGSVAGDGDARARWQLGALVFIRNGHYFFGCANQVLACAFDDAECDDRFAVKARKILFFFKSVGHRSNVSQKSRIAPERPHQDIFDVAHALELSNDPQRAPEFIDAQIPRRNVYVLAGDGVFNVGKRKARHLHFVQINVYLNFALGRTNHVYPGDFFESLDFIFQVFGVFLQLRKRQIAHNIDLHDGLFRNVHFLDLRILVEVGRQVIFGLVHGVAHF